MIRLAFLHRDRAGLRFWRDRMRRKPLSFDFARLWAGAGQRDV
jgi:hypothetical protein